MSALGYDPVPGDVDAVRRVATMLGAVADQADSITTRLRGIDDGTGPQVWRGPAADAFHRLLDDIGPDVIRLASAHREAEDALRSYAGDLDGAQFMGRRAESDAGLAISDRERAEADRARAAEEAAAYQRQVGECRLRLAQAGAARLTALTDPVYQAELTHYEGQVRGVQQQAESRAAEARGRENAARSAGSAAEARVQAARLLAEQAKQVRDDSARRVVDRLATAGRLGLANGNPVTALLGRADDLLRGIATNPYFLDFLTRLDEVNGAIALVGGIAMLVPGMQPVGTVLLGASTVLAVVSLSATVLAASYGQRGAGDVAWGVVGLIPGLKQAKGLRPGLRGVLAGRAGTVKRLFAYAGRRPTPLRSTPIAPRIDGLQKVVLHHGRIDPRVYYGVRIGVDTINLGRDLETGRSLLEHGIRTVKPLVDPLRAPAGVPTPVIAAPPHAQEARL